jgi:hypothetical protein
MSSYPLETFWPLGTVPDLGWEKEKDLTLSVQIGTFNRHLNGFSVLHRPHFESDSALSELLLIPRRYKNGLRLLNAKISYLQQCLRLLSAPERQTSQDGLENMRLARDSVMRNLVFNCKTRLTFFDNINEVFGTKHGREGMPVKQLRDDFKSLTMIAWLHCEIRLGRHDPHYVKEMLIDVDWESSRILQGEFHLTSTGQLFLVIKT